MLDRRDDKRAQQKRQRQKRLRVRQARGQFCITIEIGQEVLSLLLRNRWIAEGDVNDTRKIAAAVSLMLATSAKI